jgi:glyoxylate reductase
MEKIIATKIFPGKGFEILKKKFDFKISKEIGESKFLISFVSDNIDKEFLGKNKHLLGICNYAAGVNNIDLKTATELGIPVTNTPAVVAESTAEHTFAIILSLVRKFIPADKFVREGKFTEWDPNIFLGMDLKGKTLGIVGYGKVGKAVAKIAKGFGMKIIAIKKTKGVSDEGVEEAGNLDELLSKSDVVTLHVPLMAETKHLIDINKLKKMKKTAFLINVSRGPVVKEDDLAKALKEGIIAGAGLDVFEFEPKVNKDLLEMKNTVLLPHIGTATLETRNGMTDLILKNVEFLIQGKESPYTVNPEVYKTEAYKKKLKEYLK